MYRLRIIDKLGWMPVFCDVLRDIVEVKKVVKKYNLSITNLIEDIENLEENDTIEYFTKDGFYVKFELA